MSWIKQDFSYNDLQRLLIKLTEKVKVFQGLTQAEVIELISHAEKCTFEPDSTIVKEGNAGSHMYIILRGEAVVSKKGHGSDVELARLTAADSFGEMALADQEARSATVTALTSCVLVRINEHDLGHKPEIAMKFYRNMAKVLSERLRSTNELLAWQV